MEKELRKALRQKDAKESCECLDRMYKGIIEHEYTVNQAKKMHMMISQMLMKAAEEYTLDQAIQEKFQDQITSILNSETLPESILIMKELIGELCIRPERQTEEGVLGRRAVRYIESHYQESSLCLQSCADALKVSPEHLSRTVKGETGHNFSEIINRLRLKCAKGYLLNTDKKMAEIAELSGYGTAKSFFRSFKQAEKVTPGEWRKRYFSEEN